MVITLQRPSPEPEALSALTIGPDVALRDVAQVSRTLSTPDCRAWDADGHPVSIGSISFADPSLRTAVTEAVARVAVPAGVAVTVVTEPTVAEVFGTGDAVGAPLARAVHGLVLDHPDGRLTVVAGGALDPVVAAIRAVPEVVGVAAVDSTPVRIIGPEAEVDRVAADVQKALAAIPGVTADRNAPPARPSMGLAFDRNVVAALGLPMSESPRGSRPRSRGWRWERCRTGCGRRSGWRASIRRA